MAENKPSASPNPYSDPEYRKNRTAALEIIPKSNLLSAINRNAGTIFSGLATAAAAVIVLNLVNIPLWGTISLITGAIIAGTASAYAAYKDENMSKPIAIAYNEANQIAQARLNGKELANAMKETIGEELHNIKKESLKTQQAIAAVQQKLLNWQDREIKKEKDCVGPVSLSK